MFQGWAGALLALAQVSWQQGGSSPGVLPRPSERDRGVGQVPVPSAGPGAAGPEQQPGWGSAQLGSAPQSRIGLRKVGLRLCTAGLGSAEPGCAAVLLARERYGVGRGCFWEK